MRRIALLAILAAAPARANPVDSYGLGARNPAMGGAATASTDGDSSATYYNPAAIATAGEIRIDLGYQASLPSLTINGGDQGVDSTHGIVGGLVVPGHIGPFKLAFGLAVLLPDERVIRLRTYPSDQPRWMYYDNRPQRFFLATSLALQLTDDLWVGGGISYVSRTQGKLNLSGRVGFPSAADSSLNLDISVDLVAVRYPSAGILWRVQPWLDVGFTYRGSFTLQVDQGFSIRGDIGPATQAIVSDAFLSLTSLSLDHFQPLELAAGFSARVAPAVLVAGDLTYARWSDFDNPSSLIQLLYDFKDFNRFVKIPPAPPLPLTYFHDIFIPRIGVEVTASRRLTLRAGYSFEPTPAPEQRGSTNFVDNDKHTLTAGAGVRIFGLGAVVPQPIDLDVYFATTILPDRAHEKFSLLDPVGDYISGGHIFFGGVESRWRF